MTAAQAASARLVAEGLLRQAADLEARGAEYEREGGLRRVEDLRHRAAGLLDAANENAAGEALLHPEELEALL